MDVSVRKKALLSVKKISKAGDFSSANYIAEIFEADATSPVDDLAFYGKILLAAQQYDRAAVILKLAYKKSRSYDISRDYESVYWLNRSREDIREMRAGAALSFVMDQPDINSVLDVGAGGGEHALELAKAGKIVDCVDFGRSIYFDNGKQFEKQAPDNINFTIGDFFDFKADHTYDLVWCSHVLEHQLNANAFLRRCLDLVTEGKWLAITVPPLKHAIVGGHVSLWNAGLLLYQLVMSGNDCSNAHVMNYNYNISVIVKKCSIELPELDYDAGDIKRLSAFMPKGCDEGFDGRMVFASAILD